MDLFSSLFTHLAATTPAKNIDFVTLTNQLLNGIGIVGVLLLTGLGLAITFGVMRIINLAHGEFIMLGAYITFLLQSTFKLDLLLTIPFAFLGTAIIGAIVELTIIRLLYGRPLETLLATWGLSIVLQGIVKLIFTAQLKYVKAPRYITGNLTLFKSPDGQSVEISYYRMFIIAVALGLLAITAYLLYGTSLGRASSESCNPESRYGEVLRCKYQFGGYVNFCLWLWTSRDCRLCNFFAQKCGSAHGARLFSRCLDGGCNGWSG